MLKIYLNVPFHEKDEAKKLGAKWDPSTKKWYILENINTTNFTKWLPQKSDSKKLRALSNKYYIVGGKHTCWKCAKDTKVWAIQLYEENKTPNYYSFLNYIKYLPEDVISEMSKYSKFYKKDYSKTTDEYYYMNHCEHCNSKPSDFGLYEEPDGGFCIIKEEDKNDIIFYLIESPLCQL